MELIKRQKWKNLFKRRDLMYETACKEFYKNLTVSISRKKEVARSCVHGINIELDGMILASILRIPGNNGIYEYIKEKWEESTHCKPLEITRRFVNDKLITKARRVKSSEMKLFQRLLHFIVMKNIAPRFGKTDTTSFMDLTYMDHLLARRKVNLPRLKRENGLWWLVTGANRRRDDVVEEVNAEAENDEAPVENGETKEKEDEIAESGSREKFYDVVDNVDERFVDEQVPTAPNVDVPAPTVPKAPVAQTSAQPKGKTKKPESTHRVAYQTMFFCICKLRWIVLSKRIPDSRSCTN
ncbi:hypothetical protein Dimus_034984 [Dionaea muscipula]